MTRKHPLLPLAGFGAALALALGLASAPQAAQARNYAFVREVAATVTVKAVDPATREVTVQTDSGDYYVLIAPPEVRNFDRIRVGARVWATYNVETAIVISPPNTPLPPDVDARVADRAARGDLPQTVVTNHIVLTGAVLRIDMAEHTLRIVNPGGGQVHTVKVDSSEGQAAMSALRVGETITVYIADSMLISIRPG
jgi:hypothetical protein